MRYMSIRQIVAFALVSGALNLSACERATVEPSTPPFDLALSVSRAAIRSGDSTTVKATFTNITNHVVLAPPDDCPIPFEVLKDDHVIFAGSGVCPAIFSSVAIRPGESHTMQFVWHGESPSWAVMLDPGSYSLRGFTFVGDNEIRSNSVSVEILR